ncbi:lipid-droplet associated hydrolase domain-containing protein [Sarocladium implicatum]|nr:lipid-droplet associated hydrolase domain-containing protein [Sarocladium implicatum]
MPATAIPSVSHLSCRSREANRHVLIYFICGNPGLIDYYRHFLLCLCTLIEIADPNAGTAYDIYGRNLPGFSDSDHDVPFSEANPPWGLDGVIEDTYEDVVRQSKKYDEVILMGHSVGAFITVELFHRHEKRRTEGLELKHGILLFPTISHIALSRSGRVFTGLMAYVPLLRQYAHVLARLVISLVPGMVVLWYLRLVLGFSEAAAKTTLGWVKSRDGVWQTLWLAGEEMEMIKGDERWGEEIWEVANYENEKKGAGRVPKFFMLYGKKDHWVADHARDQFVERMKEGDGTRIEIDEGDLPHAFSTSYHVAERVAKWVDDIEQARMQRARERMKR